MFQWVLDERFGFYAHPANPNVKAAPPLPMRAA
jgi:hypothetical protein